MNAANDIHVVILTQRGNFSRNPNQTTGTDVLKTDSDSLNLGNDETKDDTVDVVHLAKKFQEELDREMETANRNSSDLYTKQASSHVSPCTTTLNSVVRLCDPKRDARQLLDMLTKYETEHVSGKNSSGKSSDIVIVPLDQDIFQAVEANSFLPVVYCDISAAAAGMATKQSLWSSTIEKMVERTFKLLGLIDGRFRKVLERKQIEARSQLIVEDAQMKTKSYGARIRDALREGKVFDSTNLQLKPRKNATEVKHYVGKVRDRYEDGENVILVTTDRLTGFDRPLAKIPFKGQVLNLVSKWWFKHTEHIIPNHIVDKLDGPKSQQHPNVTVGKACKPFPIEFVVRGFITGSSATAMWTHYANGVRSYCGHLLPDGLVKNQRLSHNMVTPTTKSDEHDELITPERIVEEGWMTKTEWEYCAAKALQLFDYGQEVALKRGLILVDTKYEMGRDAETDEILLIDEIHTPDSSRYWLASTYEKCMREGQSPDNIDKEFVRLWFKERCDPYKDEVLPTPPENLLVELSRRYIMLYELITGEEFSFPDAADMDANAAVQRALDMKQT